MQEGEDGESEEDGEDGEGGEDREGGDNGEGGGCGEDGEDGEDGEGGEDREGGKDEEDEVGGERYAPQPQTGETGKDKEERQDGGRGIKTGSDARGAMRGERCAEQRPWDGDEGTRGGGRRGRLTEDR